MLIETSHERYMEVLNLGSFPKKVLDFQDSHDYFQQIIFVDYQIQLLLEHEFSGRLFRRNLLSKDDELPAGKIAQLVDYAQLIDANYSTVNKRYEESLYYTVVLAHLHNLALDAEASFRALRSFHLNPELEPESPIEAGFIDYLTARYYSLMGLTSADAYTHWVDYLVNMRKYGTKSQISANRWTDSIFKNVLSVLTSGGNSPLRFKDILAQQFADNACCIVALCNYAMKAENEKYVLKEFRTDYIVFLADLVSNKIKQTIPFPDASEDNYEDLFFVESLYETLNDISSHRPVVTHFLKPKLSKKFLVNMSEKTYQSTIVLLNLIRTLIDAEEYDEALAAFKTYVCYTEEAQKQHEGAVNNILDIIDIYSVCIENFNPLKSFIPIASSSTKKFKYNSIDNVVSDLARFTLQLVDYLRRATVVANLSYDEELDSFADNKLSFLYHRYNTNLLLGDKSKFVRILSRAWFSLGQFSYYLATFSSASFDVMKENTQNVLLYYKNSLIINSTGNVTYLFNYALTLATANAVAPAVKLCKFILKRYPESFKTWNLMVLLVTALENEAAVTGTEYKSSHSNTRILDSITENGDESGNAEANGNAPASKPSDLEKFIDDALNVAGIYIMKNRQSGVTLPFQTKYEILQLKMTQLAVWEAKHGVEYILESVAEVFVLYKELFQDVETSLKDRHLPPNSILGARSEGRWSHRPSVIDPSEINGFASKPLRNKELAKEKISKLTSMGGASTVGAPSIVTRAGSVSTRAPRGSSQAGNKNRELRVLQEVWLWTASIFLKLELLDEAEQCIVEAESVDRPNVKTFTYLGLLTSKTRKFLSLQEYERSLEIFHSPEERYNKKAYGLTLLSMCKLFIIDDELTESLFISSKDLDAGLIRLKNYLEGYSNCWPYGHNNPELWYYLSTIYEKFDDKLLYNQALWKCVELETNRPVRSYDVCDDFAG